MMNLLPLLNRQIPPVPWAEGEKIPWNDPGFSRRMLQEHLSQDHDLASRRQATIDRHVEWIFTKVMKNQPGRVLDLGCGPGFYSNRLAKLGCQVTGIDYSPASIDYARQHNTGLPVKFIEANIVEAEYGRNYDLVMLIFGELNAFHPDHARMIIRKAADAIKPGGSLLLEVSRFESLKPIASSPSWSTHQHGLFSDRPYLLLSENFWDDDSHIITERYYVIDLETARHTRMTASTQAYTDEEYLRLLDEAGFTGITISSNMTGESCERNDVFPITAIRPG